LSKLPPLFNIQRLITCSENNTLVLTPNNRLHSKALQAWGEYQQHQKARTWRPPRIQVITQWLQQQWLILQAKAYPVANYVIANRDQQRVIWEEITADCQFMQTEAIARQANQAHQTLQRWNLFDRKKYPELGINPQLVQWIDDFQQRLSSMGYITLEDSYQIIAQAWQTQTLPQEAQIALLGFDDVPPLLKSLLMQATPTVEHLPGPKQQPESLQRFSFDNRQEEMQACAQWARSLLEQQSHIRIGIIAPNLGQCRQQIEQAFIAEFEAHSFLPHTERYTLPFNLSAGTPLGDTPLISSTLKILHLYKNQWDIELIESILLCPFWGAYTDEFALRCAVVERLKSMGVFTISADNLRYWAEHLDEKLANGLPTHDRKTHTQLFPYFYQLQSFYHAPKHGGQQLPSQWVDIVLEHLSLLNWPGERTPDSQEYQQTQHWYQVLENFANLDHALGPINHHQALQQLQYMANHTPFQAKVPDSPIQILGVLEGSGLQYTHCWIIGMDQQAWPPAPKPNPMLPIQLQREYNMPHASSLRELDYAQSLTQNYRYCARHIVFSAPTVEDDGEQVLLPSQLIADIPLSLWQPKNHPNTLTQWEQKLSESVDLELVDCQQAPDYNKTHLPGGSGLLKAQAANPFDCFVKYRLYGQPPVAPVNGFSALDKGHILHSSLAMIWRYLKTQQALLAYSEQALNKLIHQSIQRSINDVRNYKPRHLSHSLCNIEQQRQHRLIAAWLDQEKQRPPFTVIETEAAKDIQFAGKTLQVRIDRVDQLQDGRYVIIDYKTSDATTNVWESERPKDPQLPLYALSYSKPVRGISFAQINIQKHCFRGLADGKVAEGINTIESNRTSLPENWEGALKHWQKVLEGLLAEFVEGDCRIQYNDNTALRYAEPYVRISRYYERQHIEEFMNTGRHV
jgi:ATP-dependent helicase/nuclease subunit B